MLESSDKKVTDLLDIALELIRMKKGTECVLDGERIGQALLLISPKEKENMEINATIDKYCFHCKKEKTFQVCKDSQYRLVASLQKIKDIFMQSVLINHSQMPTIDRYKYIKQTLVLKLECPTCKSSIHMIYSIENGKIIKIEEYPNPIKAENLELRKYDILDEDFSYKNELSTANYLYYDCNASIGAFTYARRCLEHFIYSLINRCLNNKSISNKDVEKASKFETKVNLVKAEIKTVLYDTIKPLYSIMSKGIHELSEEECKMMFEICFNCVKSLLDDEVYKKELEKNLQKQRNAISQLNAHISKK